LAAREISASADRGGRYREAAVLVRKMDGYAVRLRGIFTRMAVPFFWDPTRGGSHHPLAEIDGAGTFWRTGVFDWAHDDVLLARSNGVGCRRRGRGGSLENEACGRGWQGDTWVPSLCRETANVAVGGRFA